MAEIFTPDEIARLRQTEDRLRRNLLLVAMLDQKLGRPSPAQRPIVVGPPRHTPLQRQHRPERQSRQRHRTDTKGCMSKHSRKLPSDLVQRAWALPRDLMTHGFVAPSP